MWGRFDNHQPDFDLEHFLAWSMAAIVLAGILLILLRTQRRQQGNFTSNSSSRLFGELCQAHELSPGERRMLKRLARTRSLSNPALLFVEPRFFNGRTLPKDSRIDMAEIERLRNQLFQHP